MKKAIAISSLVLCILQHRAAHAQIPLLYTDTTVSPGSALTLGIEPPATAIFLDDYYSNAIPIGFSFTYFGTTYTQCLLNGNGVLSFATDSAGKFAPYIFSDAVSQGYFNRAILYPFQDFQFAQGGSTSYTTVGIAPHRRFIVDYCKAPLYACETIKHTGQLILSEGSNIIEMHITSRPNVCSSYYPNTAVQGLRNGTTEIYVPGRGWPQTSWTTSDNATRFTPAGPNNYTISTIPFNPWYSIATADQGLVQWYNENNVQIGTGPSVTVTPGLNMHYYTARYSGMVRCEVNKTFSDTRHVQTTTPLPLHLLGFTGKAEGAVHRLDWKMNEEEAGAKYILQYSTDAASYKDIYETGVQNQLQGSYTYHNEHTLAGDNYYRLQIQTAAGKLVQSPVIRIGTRALAANSVTVYPNPARDYVNISADKSVKLLQLVLVDVTGNVKYNKTTAADATLYTIPLQEIPAGIYYLKAITDKGVVTKSVTVVKP